MPYGPYADEHRGGWPTSRSRDARFSSMRGAPCPDSGTWETDTVGSLSTRLRSLLPRYRSQSLVDLWLIVFCVVTLWRSTATDIIGTHQHLPVILMSGSGTVKSSLVSATHCFNRWISSARSFLYCELKARLASSYGSSLRLNMSHD